MTDPARSADDLAPRSPLLFIVLTFVLAVPFLVLSGATGIEILPRLPIAAFMAACPAAAARYWCWPSAALRGNRAAWTRRPCRAGSAPMVRGRVSAQALAEVCGLRRHPLGRRGRPAAGLLHRHDAWAVRLLPDWRAVRGARLWGYAIDPLQQRWGALGAAVFLGLVWAAFHYIALLQTHRSAAWIAWWTLGTVATRVLIVWLYNGAGRSVPAAVLFHAMGNLTSDFPRAWVFLRSACLRPSLGRSGDPRCSLGSNPRARP